MEKIFNKVMVVDGSYLLHRQLHLREVFELRNKKGERTGGIFGFMRSLLKEISICGNYYPVVCLDDGLDPRRTAIDPNYKRAAERSLDESQRQLLTPEEAKDDYVTQYRQQRNKLVTLLSYFGIPAIKLKNVEGDDIMKILTLLSKESIVLTDDRDLLQLLSDSNHCTVRRPMANETHTEKGFLVSKEYYDIDSFIMEKAILGDGSDNIPGCCKQVGPSSVGEFIKFLKILKLSNKNDVLNATYPSTVDEIKSICDEHYIKYKKAYSNFDKDRYYKNLQLVDLNLVSLSDDIINSIIATVSNCRSTIDYFKAIQMLSELDINNFSADDMMSAVNSRFPNLELSRQLSFL